MSAFRHLLWMVKNWRYRWIAVAGEGVYVFEVGGPDGVRGARVDGSQAEAIKRDLDAQYDGRHWDSARGRWIEV